MNTLFALFIYTGTYGGASWTQQGVFQNKEHCERAIAALGKIERSRCVDTGIPNGVKEKK